jgi:hypothetical protein
MATMLLETRTRTILQEDINLKTMNPSTFCSIVSRAKYKVRMLYEGTSRGDSHRKHIFERFEYLSSLDWRQGQRIDCDKCHKIIEMGMPIYIHRRRSYNRFFHQHCAMILNIL